ncbi:MAG: B12-binding domain-containing radical SAM protein [Proteobacteria bacterium]|nr:B12-binding domain-containing radical SAM protein [Pseudomonadota bacterium]MBU1581826.1 B12-binding domain-containing radical SAM protein [Pseudomonadota bacterium]MBU2628339.1 B12-binding domain-containing radical SAM protein [Pseudomonadota bacterium]
MILINSSSKKTMGVFSSFLPVYVPVGCGYLLAAAHEDGIDMRLVDEQIVDDPLSVIKTHVKTMSKPYIFGFSVVTAAYKSAIELSIKLKEVYPESIIVFGGIHPSAASDEVLAYEHIDVVVRGEAEKILNDLIRCIKERKPYTHLDGLSYRENGNIIHNKPGPIIKDLNNMPGFPYHLFDDKSYHLGFVVSSRGCPYNCIFCSNRITTGKFYRYRTSESTIEELELLFRDYGVKHVYFVDDNFVVNKKRVFKLIDLIKNSNIFGRMTFSFQGRADNFDPNLFKALYDTGFTSVDFGMETASESVMKIIKKGETVAECVDAVKAAKEIGFHVSTSFIYGLPTETHEDRMGAIELSKQLDIDSVKFNNATPFPGTELYEIAKKEKRLNIKGLYENFNSVSTIIENPFKKNPFSYVPQGSTEQGIRRDIIISYMSVWFSWKRMKKLLTNPSEGQGWFNAGESFVEKIKKVPPLFLLGGVLMIKCLGALFSKESQ